MAGTRFGVPSDSNYADNTQIKQSNTSAHAQKQPTSRNERKAFLNENSLAKNNVAGSRVPMKCKKRRYERHHSASPAALRFVHRDA
jgi:hypothetical protein